MPAPVPSSAAVSLSIMTSQPRFASRSESSASDAAISGLRSLPIRATRPKLGFTASASLRRGACGRVYNESMLDKRAQVLLKTLIERYIAEGQPIGSRTLSRYSGLDLSPATIRNVMSDLEELGFIASPHTSAGRVPTPAGYRFFVDTLLVVKQLESGDLRELQGQLHPDNPQRVIHSASN